METKLAHVAKDAAKQHNHSDLSNAYMPRLPPLAIWTSTLNDLKEIERAIYADVEFIHCVDTVKQMCFIYTASMNYLLKNPEDQSRARNAYDLAVQLSKDKDP